ncbi:MAG: glycosyl hydrolase family 28 protein [Planctomycetia bacterium]|nr:glycosyl hydrolase family 28 protein [Planctomycetia bacterium]
MKIRIVIFPIVFLCLVLTLRAEEAAIFPIPEKEPLCDLYDLYIGNRPVPVYQCRISAVPFNQVWPGYQRPIDQTEIAGFAYWEMDTDVAVRIVCKAKVQKVDIHPKVLKIEPQIQDKTISFSLKDHTPVVVEINGTRQPLHLFPAEKRKELADKSKQGLRYFGPGVHHPGKIVLKTGESVYIDAGAVVYGNIYAKDACDIKISGRGILDNSKAVRKARFREDSPTGTEDGCIHMYDCRNVSIDGIILRDSDHWTCSLFNCENISIYNLKLIGQWRYNSDGIDLANCRNALIENCFVRTFDDCLCVKGFKTHTDFAVEKILFRNCVLLCDWGCAIKMGGETSAPSFTNVAFENINIIRTSGTAISIPMHDRARISDIRFENFRINIDSDQQRPALQKNREDHYIPQDVKGSPYCPTLLQIAIKQNFYSKDKELGQLRNVLFRNIQVYTKLQPKSFFEGADADHDVQGIRIENLRFNDDPPVSDAKQMNLKVGNFVSDLKFQ